MGGALGEPAGHGTGVASECRRASSRLREPAPGSGARAVTTTLARLGRARLQAGRCVPGRAGPRSPSIARDHEQRAVRRAPPSAHEKQPRSSRSESSTGAPLGTRTQHAMGHVGVPDRAGGVDAVPSGGRVAEVGPGSAIVQAPRRRRCRSRSGARRRTRPRSGSSCRRVTAMPLGKAIPSATSPARAIGGHERHDSRRERLAGHQVEAAPVDVGIAAAVDHDLVPALVRKRVQVGIAARTSRRHRPAALDARRATTSSVPSGSQSRQKGNEWTSAMTSGRPRGRRRSVPRPPSRQTTGVRRATGQLAEGDAGHQHGSARTCRARLGLCVGPGLTGNELDGVTRSTRRSGSTQAPRAKLGPWPSFCLQMAHGPAWDESRGIREQDGWDEHARVHGRAGRRRLRGPRQARGRASSRAPRGRSRQTTRPRCGERLGDDPWHGEEGAGASGRWSGGRSGWTGPAGRRPAALIDSPQRTSPTSPTSGGTP